MTEKWISFVLIVCFCCDLTVFNNVLCQEIQESICMLFQVFDGREVMGPSGYPRDYDYLGEDGLQSLNMTIENCEHYCSNKQYNYSAIVNTE